MDSFDFKQQEGIDFVGTFAVVVKPMLYKSILAVNVEDGYKI